MVVASVEVPATTKKVLGVVDPIPTLPLLRIVSLSFDPVLKMMLPDPLASESPVMIASTAFERDAAEPRDAEDIVEPSEKMICPPDPWVIRMSPFTVRRDAGVEVPSPSLPVV